MKKFQEKFIVCRSGDLVGVFPTLAIAEEEALLFCKSPFSIQCWSGWEKLWEEQYNVKEGVQ